jgi:hypothetical protein
MSQILFKQEAATPEEAATPTSHPCAVLACMAYVDLNPIRAAIDKMGKFLDIGESASPNALLDGFELH